MKFSPMFCPIWIEEKNSGHKLYDAISLQYEWPIILKAGTISGAFDVQNIPSEYCSFWEVTMQGGCCKELQMGSAPSFYRILMRIWECSWPPQLMLLPLLRLTTTRCPPGNSVPMLCIWNSCWRLVCKKREKKEITIKNASKVQKGKSFQLNLLIKEFQS